MASRAWFLPASMGKAGGKKGGKGPTSNAGPASSKDPITLHTGKHGTYVEMQPRSYVLLQKPKTSTAMVSLTSVGAQALTLTRSHG